MADVPAMQGIVRRRRMMRAANTGLMHLASLVVSTEVSASGSKPALPLALGWTSPAPMRESWISQICAASAATILSNVWYKNTRQTNDNRRLAKTSGELMAYWSCDEYTPDAMGAARAQIAQALRSFFSGARTPLTTVVANVVREMAKIETFRGQTVPNQYIPGIGIGEAVASQRHAFYSMYAPSIPPTLFENDEFRAWWVRVMNNQNANAPTAAFAGATALIENISPVIVAMNDDQIMDLHEAWARHKMVDNRSTGLAAAFIGIAALCKGGNATSNWVTSRLNQLHQRVPEIDLSTVVTADIIREFENLYSRDNLTDEQVYRALMMSYMALTEQNHKSLSWIIEQAAASNVTPLLALATAVTRSPRLNLDIALKNETLSLKLVELARACYHVIKFPLQSVRKPPIRMRLYADWGFIGIELRKALIADRDFANYMGNLSSMTALSVSALKAIVQEMLERNESAQGAEISSESILSAHFNATVIQNGDHYYITPNNGAPVIDVEGMEGQVHRPVVAQPQAPRGGDQAAAVGAAQAEPGAGGRQAYHVENQLDMLPRVDEENLQAQQQAGGVDQNAAQQARARRALWNQQIASVRAAWPQRMRNLPVHGFRLSVGAADKMMADNQTNVALALRRVLAAVDSAATQMEMAVPHVVRQNNIDLLVIPSPYKNISAALAADLVALGMPQEEIDRTDAVNTLIPLPDGDQSIRRPVGVYPYQRNAPPPPAQPAVAEGNNAENDAEVDEANVGGDDVE